MICTFKCLLCAALAMKDIHALPAVPAALGRHTPSGLFRIERCDSLKYVSGSALGKVEVHNAQEVCLLRSNLMPSV